MSGGNADPRCPECDGPVSATAPYCLHCGADLGATSSDPTPTTDRQQTAGNQAGTTSGSSAASDRLLDPEGLLDDSLTLLVGLVGGTAVGLLMFLLFGIITQSGWSILAGGLAWLAGTGYLSTRHSIGETIRYGCYAVALLLVLFPFVSFAPATKGGNFAGRVLLFFAAELLFGVFAAGLAGVGYVAGKK